MRPLKFYSVGIRETIKHISRWVPLFWKNFAEDYDKREERLKGFTFPPTCGCRWHQGFTDDSSEHNAFVSQEERK